MRTWQATIWQSRPGLERNEPRPLGAPPLVLVIVLAVALAAHGFPTASSRLPARIRGEVHGEIVGKARVIDGDTIVIAGTHVRLEGIDAPESDQTCTDTGSRAWRCGRAATRVLIGLIAGQPLTCETSGLDRYRRLLAVCALPDGSDVNAYMVQQGWALVYYSDAYRSQEEEAHAARRGIWAGSFMPPWEWRHRHLR